MLNYYAVFNILLRLIVLSLNLTFFSTIDFTVSVDKHIKVYKTDCCLCVLFFVKNKICFIINDLKMHVIFAKR